VQQKGDAGGGLVCFDCSIAMLILSMVSPYLTVYYGLVEMFLFTQEKGLI